MWEDVFLRVSHAPVLSGGTQRPQSFGVSYMRAHKIINNNQVLPGDQDVRHIFTRLTTNAEA